MAVNFLYLFWRWCVVYLPPVGHIVSSLFGPGHLLAILCHLYLAPATCWPYRVIFIGPRPPVGHIVSSLFGPGHLLAILCHLYLAPATCWPYRAISIGHRPPVGHIVPSLLGPGTCWSYRAISIWPRPPVGNIVPSQFGPGHLLAISCLPSPLKRNVRRGLLLSQKYNIPENYQTNIPYAYTFWNATISSLLNQVLSYFCFVLW